MSPPAAKSPYTGYRFPAEVISHAVWLYFRFPLSLRMVEEMLAARGIERQHGLGLGLDGGIARDLQVADHLDRAGARLRFGRRLPAEHRACRGLGVERVILAAPAACTTVGAVDLEDAVPGFPQGSRKTCAIGSGALDAEGP